MSEMNQTQDVTFPGAEGSRVGVGMIVELANRGPNFRGRCRVYRVGPINGTRNRRGGNPRFGGHLADVHRSEHITFYGEIRAGRATLKPRRF